MENVSGKKQRAQTFKLRSFKKYKVLYFMMIPALLYFIIFCYTPMYGILMAFKDYKISKGVMGSDWVGLYYFQKLFPVPGSGACSGIHSLSVCLN